MRDNDDDYEEKEIQFSVPSNDDYAGDSGLRTIKVQKENTCKGNRSCGIDLRTDIDNTGMDAEEYYGGTSLWCHYGKCQHMYVANNVEPTLDDTIKYLAKDCNKNSPLQVPAIKNEGGNGWAGVQCTGHYTRENLTNTAGPGQNLLKPDQTWIDYLGDVNDQSMELSDLQCKYSTKANWLVTTRL